MNDDPNDRFEDDDNDDINDGEEDFTLDDDDGEEDGEEADDADDDAEARRAASRIAWREKFDALCVALEQNNASVTNVNFVPFRGYGIPLGRALVGNTHVKFITLHLSPEYVGEDEGVESLALLLQYLREGPSLQQVEFHDSNVLYTRPCMEALSRHSGIQCIMFYFYDVMEVPVDALSHLLRTTRSLKRISLPMVDNVGLAHAFGANRTLHSVTLDWNPEASTLPIGGILRHLHSHPTLENLSITKGRGDPIMQSTRADVALSGLLTSTSTLTRLSFSCQSFGEEKMRHLIQGLHSNRTLTKLHFRYCIFDTEAIEVVESFARTTDGASLTTIVELKVHQPDHDDDFNNARLVALLAAGSHHMKTLHWTWHRSTTDSRVFWNMLESHAASIRIQEIQLPDVPLESLVAMSTCVPKLVYLQELHIGWTPMFQQPELYHQFADMVRKSGSLRTVSLERWFYAEYNETAFKVVQASLERNRNLPQLLTAAGCDTTPGSGNEAQGESMATEVNLVPTLMLSAVQAPQVAPNQLLTSMLALSESVTGQ